MAFATEKDYSGRGEGGELTPQEEIFIQNLAAQCVYDSNKVVRLNSNNGGLAKSILKVDDTGNYLVWSSVNWGEITGTLSNQTDLQNALNQKANDSIVLKKDGSVSLTSNWNVDGGGTLFIDKTNGRVGIGTTSPRTALEVVGSTWLKTRSANDAGTLIVEQNTNAVQLRTYQSGINIIIGNNTSNVLLATGTGNVGIGTISPSAKLHVHEQATDRSGVLINTQATGSGYYALDVQSGGTSRLYVGANGNVGVGINSPSLKLEVYGSGSDGVAKFRDVNNGVFGSILIGIGKISSDMGHFNFGNGKVFFSSDGNVGIGTTNPTSKLHIQGATGYNQLRLSTSYTPTGTGDANGNVGDICWDDNYFYIKTTGGWKRTNLSTF